MNVAAGIAVFIALSVTASDRFARDVQAAERTGEDEASAPADVAERSARQVKTEGFSAAGKEATPSTFKDSTKKAIGNPATLNTLVKSFTDRDSGWAFLRDIDFSFKAFESDRSGEDSSLGFSYAFDRSLGGDATKACGGRCSRGYDISLTATGNVAFEKRANPNDFLNTKLSVALFQSYGGTVAMTKEGQSSYDELIIQAATLEEEDELETFWANVVGHTSAYLTNQYFVSMAGEVALESNQDFSETQWVYGGRLGLDVRGWQKSGAASWSTASALAKWNLLDYPFAFVRMLTGFDDCDADSIGCFVPRGVSLPTASAGIGLVDPKDDDPRTALAGDRDAFTRVDFEASFHTPVARYSDEEIYFTANYRYYKELDPDFAVEAADLDEFDFVTLTIGGVSGPFLSYTAGRLPLDRKSDQVFEIGFQTHF